MRNDRLSFQWEKLFLRKVFAYPVLVSLHSVVHSSKVMQVLKVQLNLWKVIDEVFYFFTTVKP